MKKIVIMILAALLLVSCATTEKSAKVYEYTEADVMIDAGDHKVPATITVPVVEEGEADFGQKKDAEGNVILHHAGEFKFHYIILSAEPYLSCCISHHQALPS